MRGSERQERDSGLALFFPAVPAFARMTVNLDKTNRWSPACCAIRWRDAARKVVPSPPNPHPRLRIKHLHRPHRQIEPHARLPLHAPPLMQFGGDGGAGAVGVDEGGGAELFDGPDRGGEGASSASSTFSGRQPSTTWRPGARPAMGEGRSTGEPSGRRRPSGCTVAGRKFMRGEPRKPATNRLSGSS